MKCQNCGAEIGNSKYCEYCGSQITVEMQKEQEQLNKSGCPQCGSTNVTFKRENQGEISIKNSRKVINRTVGVCKDCGATWYTDKKANHTDEGVKKRKTWLWVLGWIFIFPLPLTFILINKKDMNNGLKYGLIVLAWAVYLILGLSGRGSSTETNKPTEDINNDVTVVSNAEITSQNENEAESGFTIINGELGDYGKKKTVDEGTELEREIVEYHIPAGNYKVINKDSKTSVQVSVYGNEWTKNDAGWDEPARTVGNPIVIMPGKEGFITVENDSYVKLSDGGAEELLFVKAN